jgi:hypothetical protein
MNRKPWIVLLTLAGLAILNLSTLKAQVQGTAVATDFRCPYCGLDLGLFRSQAAGWAAMNNHLATCPRAPHSSYTPQSYAPSGYTAAQQELYNASKSFFDSLLGNGGPSQAELEAQRRQQEEAARHQAEMVEQQRLARMAMASKLRGFWDGEDKAMSSELDGVFDVPIAHSTPFFGTGGDSGDSSVVDLRGTAAGDIGTPFDGPPLQDSSVVDFRGTSAGNDAGIVPIGLGLPGLPTGGAGIAPGSPISAPPPNPTPKVYTRAEIQLQIRQVQNALRQINRSIQLDASQRSEWENMSSNATQEAWKKLGEATVDAIMSGFKWYNQSEINSKVEEAINLNGQHLPLYLNPAEADLQVLEGEKTFIHRGEAAVDAIHMGVNVGDAATTAVSSERRENGLNATLDGVEAVDALGKFGNLPGPTGALGATRKLIDAGYLDAVQLTSVSKLSALNANSEQYLKAVNALNARLTNLVQMEKTTVP